MNFSFRGPRHRFAALLAATLAATSVVGVAGADDVSNNIDASVDATAEVMALTVPGADGTTQLYIAPTNGDGKSGCNLTGSSTLTASVASSNTAVATVTPSTVTFTSCGDTPTLTVTPHATGTATVIVTGGTNTTEGTFNFAPATFTVNVTSGITNTPPTVNLAGVTGGAAYDKGSVPAATCEVTDAEDGNSSFPAVLSAITGDYASDGIGAQTASCSYTDNGGLTASSSETYSIVDPTAPAISSLVSPLLPDGDNGWYKSNVSLDWTVSEPESPNSLVKDGCVDQSIVADQTATTYSCSATSAGGPAAQQSVTIKRDATAPTNVAFVGGPVNGGNYFPNNLPAAPTCSADDATSLLAGCTVTGYSSGLGPHTMTATATDHAGNSATATRSYNVRLLTLSGFFSPVDMGSTVNTVKGGSTVPLKFTVADEGVAQTSTTVVSSFKQRVVACGTLGSASDDIEMVTTGGTSLRYDATGGQFIQNWQTPKAPGTCYVATVTMIDGQTISASFKLK